jgi:hypothetical protein
MRALIVAAATALFATPAAADRLVRCTAPGKTDVIMRLDAKRMLGQTVSCIAGDFIEKTTPCAPNHAIGLSAPIAPFALVGIVPIERWTAAPDPPGSYVLNSGNAVRISFSGSSVNPDGTMRRWSFYADRVTGLASLEVDGQKDSYACMAAER